jgi:hypothetical protein
LAAVPQRSVTGSLFIASSTGSTCNSHFDEQVIKEGIVPDQFSEMDNWTSEQVALFKEEANRKQQQKLRHQTFVRGAKTSPEILVTEGDSWFDYSPGVDIVDCLRNHHDYVIANHASAGDTLENMIYGTGINKSFERISSPIDIVLRRIHELKPKVFLFSGGGNDVVGEEFESYLNHRNSGLPVLREQLANDMISHVFRKYLEDLIYKIEAASPQTLIVAHGYGHTAPTGKGVDFFIFRWAGPWLKPALVKKGIFEINEQRTAVFAMVDKYNEMLKELARQYRSFRYIDLRNMIDPDRDWVNELHLRNSAYARVAKRIHEEIQAL